MWQLKFLIYLCEVCFSSFAFFLLYTFFMKKLAFFRLNRIYLISALLFSFLIPSLNIQLNEQQLSIPSPAKISDQVEHIKTLSFHPIVSDTQTAINLPDFLFYTYSLISLCLLVKRLIALFQLFRQTRVVSEDINGLKVIYKYSGFVNCSFFNYVFIDPTTLSREETEMLLQHELVHAKQWHSADKLFLLLCKTVLWFNPFIYLYDAALEQAHEFEADGAALKTAGIKTYAQLLIRLADGKKTHVFTHNFGKHPIKQRVYMLFTDRSKLWSLSAYVCIVPVVVGLLSVFSIKIVAAQPLSDSAFTLILDAGHGGTDAGALAGTISEKQQALTFVKKIQSVAALKGLKVISTRNDDSNVTLKQRGNLKGDILLSVHHNTSANVNANGIEILSGNSPIAIRHAIIKNLTSHLYQNLSVLRGIHTKNLFREVTGSYLLEKSEAPSVMLELGYLSNARDRSYITNQTNQNLLAEAIVNAVLACRDAQLYQQK
jgi:N-acetylmuramoyl-L-alanine amidase